MSTLISGKTVADEAISFNPDNYHFAAYGKDITDDLYEADKRRLVPGFDMEREDLRISYERGHGAKYGTAPLPESTTLELVNNLATDPFAAPIESLGNKADQFFGTGGIQKLLVFGLLIFAAYIFIAGGWFKRR